MRETTKWWIPHHLFVDGEAVDWVLEPNGIIKKSNLTFTTKFLWLLIRHCIFPTVVNNIVTWDRAVLMDATVVGFEVDFIWLLQVVVHEKVFNATTT